MGGAEYQVKVLLDALRKENRYEIYYLARNVNPAFTPDGYTIIKIADSGGIRRYGTFLDAPRLLKILRDLKPDLIYQRVGCAYTGIAAYYAQRHQCRMIWHISSDKNVEPMKYGFTRNVAPQFIEQQIMQYGITHAHCIIAQTLQQDALLQRNYGRHATAIVPNYHPKPSENIHKSRPIKVLLIGKLHPLKQPEVFVKLARDLQHIKEAQFIMIGPPDHDQVRHNRLLEEAGKLGNFVYLGRRSQEEVNALLAEAHVLVNTSQWEGFPNTFIQAWMRKVPVVSLNVNPDKVFDKENIGFYSRSYEKLREDVKRLIENDELRESMGNDAQIYSYANHSAKNVQRVIKLLEADC